MVFYVIFLYWVIFYITNFYKQLHAIIKKMLVNCLIFCQYWVMWILTGADGVGGMHVKEYRKNVYSLIKTTIWQEIKFRKKTMAIWERLYSVKCWITSCRPLKIQRKHFIIHLELNIEKDLEGNRFMIGANGFEIKSLENLPVIVYLFSNYSEIRTITW